MGPRDRRPPGGVRRGHRGGRQRRDQCGADARGHGAHLRRPRGARSHRRALSLRQHELPGDRVRSRRSVVRRGGTGHRRGRTRPALPPVSTLLWINPWPRRRRPMPATRTTISAEASWPRSTGPPSSACYLLEAPHHPLRSALGVYGSSRTRTGSNAEQGNPSRGGITIMLKTEGRSCRSAIMPKTPRRDIRSLIIQLLAPQTDK